VVVVRTGNGVKRWGVHKRRLLPQLAFNPPTISLHRPNLRHRCTDPTARAALSSRAVMEVQGLGVSELMTYAGSVCELQGRIYES